MALPMATDREGEEFEQRIRRWLGAEEAVFDVVLVSDWLRTPAEMLSGEAGQAGSDSFEERRYRQAVWEATRTQYAFLRVGTDSPA